MSPKYSINNIDIQRWFRNLVAFLAPVSLIYLLAVISVVNTAGVSIEAFVPNQIVVGAMFLYVLNAIVDIIRKFLAAPSFPPPAGQ